MNDYFQRIADLPPEKRALLTLRLKERKAEVSQEQKIPRMSKTDSCPLSFAQQRLWFLDQFMPGQPFYNLHNAIRLTGSLDVEALERSVAEIIGRHEILRTTFITVGGQPVQVIAPSLASALPLVDLRRFPETEREALVHRLAFEEAQLPFDLTKGPLLRATLLCLDKEDHVLLLTMHHIVSDLWSLGVFIREFALLYQALSTGNPSPLPELPIQYADYAIWQQQRFQGKVLERHLSYWKRQLDNAPAVMNLPTDRPRPTVQTPRGAMQSLVLPKTLTEALKNLSRREGATLFMTLLAAFKVLLYRYTGQDDIVVGTPIASRNQSETEMLIGVFLNTLALRTDLSGNPGFRELLGRVREVVLGAYAHQDLPLEKLVEELMPERNLSYTPVFQVLFALQNVPMPELELPGLTMSLLEIDTGIARFDLSLNMEMEERHTAALVYNADLFDAATIARMLGHFRTLLESIVADPEQRLLDQSLLTGVERHQLLLEWNDTKADYSLDQCLHQLFDAQAMRTRGAAAVISEEGQLTYQELNRRANQLAHYLQALGVGPDVLVGICVERSLEMMVGLLGILKAGGAYLPLDPEYPKERLAFMLEDAQTPVILTQQRLLTGLPEYTAQVVCLDSDWKVISQKSEEIPVSGATAENLAYVIYTSGSTGRPKGVLIPHRGIVNRLLWMQEVLQLTEADRILQKTPSAFDVSVGEFFLPLLNGACLVMARPGGHRDSAYLVQLIAAQKVSFVHFVPSMLTAFLEEQGLDECGNSLRYVWCGGEVLPLELKKRFFGRLDAELYNGYGPTEASVGVTVWACKREGDLPIVPIGRPIGNTQIYLLDAHLRPVPVGVPGELHIGGVSLARGYLNRPKLTGESFIPNPFSEEPGARLYKTGDLARYLPDGDIGFLGRVDHQVKIRGFRVELEEIEAVVEQHPAVRQAVILAREGMPDALSPSVRTSKRLVAYLLPEQEYAPTSSELRSFLREKLPEYMVPSAFVPLDALPRMPNGKIDRDALPVPDESHLASEAPYAAPRSEIEQILAAIWKEVLDLEEVGIHDNFFDLGGHSLLLVMVRGQVQEEIGRDVPIAELFEYPTISSLAQHLEQEQTEQPLFEQVRDRAKRHKEAVEQQMQLGQLRER